MLDDLVSLIEAFPEVESISCFSWRLGQPYRRFPRSRDHNCFMQEAVIEAICEFESSGLPVSFNVLYFPNV